MRRTMNTHAVVSQYEPVSCDSDLGDDVVGDIELLDAEQKRSAKLYSKARTADTESEEESDIQQVPASRWQRLKDWFYPPDHPEEIQLFRLENIALPLSYLLVGTVQGLSSGVMTIYLLQINASEAQQVTVGALQSLPGAFKVLFGFLSDTTPILGYRRKLYISLGWLLSAISMGALAIVAPSKSIPSISVCYFLFGTGFWFADVISDSIMAEKAKLEPHSARGHMQSFCYACRFFMLMVTVTFVTYGYDSIAPTTIFWFIAIVPCLLLIVPLWYLREQRHVEVASVGDHVREIWSTLCSRAVWQPMSFVYLYGHQP